MRPQHCCRCRHAAASPPHACAAVPRRGAPAWNGVAARGRARQCDMAGEPEARLTMSCAGVTDWRVPAMSPPGSHQLLPADHATHREPPRGRRPSPDYGRGGGGGGGGYSPRGRRPSPVYSRCAHMCRNSSSSSSRMMMVMVMVMVMYRAGQCLGCSKARPGVCDGMMCDQVRSCCHCAAARCLCFCNARPPCAEQ